jgi:RND family efflux transporter MFP subunit
MRITTMTKFTLVALTFSFLQGCLNKPEIKAGKPLTVTTFTVQDPIATQFRDFKGTVVPADLTPLSFRLEGELNAISVHTGQHVKKGQVLAQLNSSKINQQLIDAQAQYDLSAKQWRRAQDLIVKKMISQSELDELTTSKRIAEVNLNIAKNKKKYATLVAPFNGFISTVAKESFESVQPGETIVTIYRDDIVRVKVSLSNRVLAAINPDIHKHGYQVTTSFSGDPRAYTLNYYQHTSEPDEGSTAFAFWLEMPQTQPAILAGTSANLHVDMVKAGLNITTGYIVPMTSLDTGKEKGEFYIWKISDNKVHRQSVNIIQIINDGVIINQGIQSNDKLVNSSLSTLRDNTQVQIAEKEVK